MAFDYFTPGDAEQYAFYRVPKLLINGEQFRTLSMEAKLLYGILLDRVSLSLRHGWVDEQNHVYIIYTIEQIMKEMNCSNKKAVTMLSELEKKVALVEKKRQGLGKPNLIYVKNFFTANQQDCDYDQPENTLNVDNSEMESAEMSNVHPQKCKNDTSGSVEDTFTEVKEVHGTNTNINNTDFSDNNPISSYQRMGNDAMRESYTAYRNYFMKHLDMDALLSDKPSDRDMVDGIIDIFVETCCTTKPTVWISGTEIPMNKFIKQLLCDNERKKFKKQAEAQPVVMKKYPDVYQISNVYYGHGFGDLEVGQELEANPNYRMDVFYDNKDRVKHPIIISIHGGGLMTGSKEFNYPMCLEFASRGYLVYALEYPKIPEHTIDEMLEAVIVAINTIVYSAPYMGGDIANVFIVGDSAGALLSVYATAIIHNPKLAEAFGLLMDLSKIHIRALGLISGLYYTASFDFYGLFYRSLLYGKDSGHNVLKKYRNLETSEVITTLPPCILITCKKDILKKNSIAFYKALKRNGIQCELHPYSDLELVHDFPLFQCDWPRQDLPLIESMISSGCVGNRIHLELQK